MPEITQPERRGPWVPLWPESQASPPELLPPYILQLSTGNHKGSSITTGPVHKATTTAKSTISKDSTIPTEQNYGH